MSRIALLSMLLSLGALGLHSYGIAQQSRSKESAPDSESALPPAASGKKETSAPPPSSQWTPTTSSAVPTNTGTESKSIAPSPQGLDLETPAESDFRRLVPPPSPFAPPAATDLPDKNTESVPAPKMAHPNSPAAAMKKSSALEFASPPSSAALSRPASAVNESGNVAPPVNQTVTQSPVVFLEKVGPATISAGKQLTYEIVARNVASVPLSKVVVEDQIPAGLRFIGAEPSPEVRGEHLVWNLGNLDSGAESRIKVEIQATGDGELNSNATVTFSASAAMKLQITRPRLSLAMSGPEGVQVGDVAEFLVTVVNEGTGPACGVVLHASLPQGLWHVHGRYIDAEIGNLAPGATKTIPLQLTAVKSGSQINEITVTADDGLKASAKATVLATEAVLTLRHAGPKRRFLNREAQFEIELANGGTAPAENVRVMDVLPEGLEFIAASEGGIHDPATRTVSWKIDALNPAHKRSMSVKVVAKTPGELVNRAVAQANRVQEIKSEAAIRVEGMPALLLEVVDLENPIEVGAETTYEIRILNQGTAPATGILITADVPAGMTPKSASGPTQFRVQGQQVIFEPVVKLAPRADALYRVRVIGLQPGDLRFKVQMSSEQMHNPVIQEEWTHVYNDRDEIGVDIQTGGAATDLTRKMPEAASSAKSTTPSELPRKK